ncbi:MAG: alpha/beta fold hydrolase [Bacteroidota bacterium]
MKVHHLLFCVFYIVLLNTNILQGQVESLYDKHQAELQFSNLEDGKMAYIDKGEGPVILLLHGVPTSSFLYRKMIPILVEGGYRVIAPDAFGFGFSEKLKEEDAYFPEQQAKRILNLMDNLNIDSWYHVCHDAGSLWTWEILLQEDKRIEKLILLNSIAFEEGFKPPIKPGKFLTKFMAGFYQSPLFIVLDTTRFPQKGD